MMARAAKKVIVTCEEIADREIALGDSVGNTFLPALDVDFVVHAPAGAHPTSCGDTYGVDEKHVRGYIEAANGENFRGYLENYIYSPAGEPEYAKKVKARGDQR